MTWNFKIEAAPKLQAVTRTRHITKGGERIAVEYQDEEPVPIIAASKCGKVIKSHWVPETLTSSGVVKSCSRWSGFAEKEQPVAWQPWPEPPQAEGAR